MPNMSLQELQDALIQKRSDFRFGSGSVIEDFLAPLPEVDQLELIEDAQAEGLSVTMQAFAYSEHESVQQEVIKWLNGDVYDPFVAAILTQSEFPEIVEEAEFLIGDYTQDQAGITQYFLSFTDR